MIGDMASSSVGAGDAGETGLIGAGDETLGVPERELLGRLPFTSMLPRFENSRALGEERSSRLKPGRSSGAGMES